MKKTELASRTDETRKIKQSLEALNARRLEIKKNAKDDISIIHRETGTGPWKEFTGNEGYVHGQE